MGPIISPFKPFKSVYLGIHTFGGFPKMPGKVVVSYRSQPLFKFFAFFAKILLGNVFVIIQERSDYESKLLRSTKDSIPQNSICNMSR